MCEHPSYFNSDPQLFLLCLVLVVFIILRLDFLFGFSPPNTAPLIITYWENYHTEATWILWYLWNSWIGFTSQASKGCSYIFCLCIFFLPKFFPSTQLSISITVFAKVAEQYPILFLKDVNDYLTCFLMTSVACMMHRGGRPWFRANRMACSSVTLRVQLLVR